MYISDVLKISTLNVFRRKTRSSLSALSIIIGIMSVLLVSTIGTNGEELIVSEIEKMGLQGITLYKNNEVEALPLTENDSQALKKRFKNIVETLPIVLSTGEYVFNHISSNAILFGVGERADKVYNINVIHGRIPASADMLNREYVSVIDDELAYKAYKRTNVVNKKLVIEINNKLIETRIIGVISSQKSGINQMLGGEIPDFIYLPYTTLNELRSSESVDQIAIKCEDDYDSDGSEFARYLSEIKSAPNAYLSTDISEKISNVKKITNLVSLFISAISAIALIVSGLGIMNTMFSSTVERKREIGITMAIGATSRDILICFITESVLIAFIGGVIGAVIGNLITYYVFNALNIKFTFDAIKFIIVIMISILFGAVSSAVPAIKASKLEPINALKN